MRAFAFLFVALVATADVARATSKLKLKYFDAKGAAELTRVMLRWSGTDFEDERWAIDFENGMKAPGFETAKANGELSSNLNRAPVLEVNEMVIGQSKAIERFVARRCGLLGGDDVAGARVDCVAEHVRDVATAQRDKGFSPFSRSKSDEEKAAAREEWFSSDLPSWLGRLDAAVDAGGRAVAAAGLSYADFCIWKLLRDDVREGPDAEAVAAVLEKMPNLLAIVEAVESEAAVQEWVEVRPKTRI